MSTTRTWTLSAIATIALIVGALFATGAVSFAQESTPTPTPSATTPGQSMPRQYDNANCPNMGGSSSGSSSASPSSTSGA